MSAPIMLVDDEGEILTVLSEALRLRGHDVETYENPGFADAKMDKTAYSVIVTDLRMPYLDGVSLIKSIRNSRLNRKTPIIIASGTIDKSTLTRAQGMGISGVFVKPYDVEALVLKIESLMPKENNLGDIVA